MDPRSAQRSGSRPVIGMMTTGPLLENSEEQWLGVSDAARAAGCDLICFAGTELGHPDSLIRKSNAIYDLASRERIDALVIWTARIGLLLSDAEMERFVRRYEPVPIVCVERAVAGCSTVLMDDRGGMAQAVSHLIEVHGQHRIGFVRGPENHGGAQQRYRGYLDALVAHGLATDPDLVSVPGDWNWDPDIAAEAVGKMLDRLAVPPGAIAAANDDLALGILSGLEAAGIRSPADVAVVGFDNRANIRTHDLGYEDAGGGELASAVSRRVNINAGTVELTTVNAPFAQMGRRALQIALALAREEPAPTVETVPTELVVRRSCGCFLAAHADPAPPSRERIVVGEPTGRPDAVAAQLRAVLGAGASSLPDDWATRLVATFLDDAAGSTVAGFLPLLDEYVRATARAGCEPTRWWPALVGLRPLANARLADISVVEDLWQRMQLLIAETTERFGEYRHMLDEKRNQTVREAGYRLIAARDLEELCAALVAELPRFGIPGCHVAVYASVDGFGDDPDAADDRSTARVVLAYENGARREGTDSTPFPSTRLTPHDPDRPAPSNIVALPLVVVEGQLGFVLFELGPRLGWLYQAMQEQVSSALRGVLFVQRERRAFAAVEDGRRRLEGAHAELEHRVAERTAELATANRILTEQMTERERAEQRQASLEAQLRHAQKMEAIGRLAGGVAHDFNNLLTVINGNCDSLLRVLGPGDPRRPEIEEVRYAGRRAANLTNQLLAFTRQQVLHPRRLDLNQAVSNVQAILQRLIGEDIELSGRLAEDVVPVWADDGLVEQVIFNLAANARDAMPDGGVLTIETANAHLDIDHAGRLVDVPPGDYVKLRVRDTGIGMDEAIQANVFEPFFTTKPVGKGTGLGLATVFGIVQGSGGQINLTSAPGEGTTVDIYLPAAPAESETEPETPSHQSPRGGSETILLVEDDDQVRAVTRRFLMGQGYLVLEAEDGYQALLVARGHKGPIDLVVTDVVMPRMGGLQFVVQLQEVRPGNRVLYMSGYTDGYPTQEQLVGASLLKKPFSEDVLLRQVRALLDQPRPAG
jgi:signal transduction histidine kinase/DNA-binding LacI/PurR family transcriptional regulator